MERAVRCVAPIVAAHPSILNSRDQATAKTLLQYAIEKNHNGALLEALLRGNHTVALTRDAAGRTALSVAVERTRKKAVRLLLQAIVEGRISRIPDSMAPVLALPGRVL